MTTGTLDLKLRPAVDAFFSRAMPRTTRTLRQFITEELVLPPGGPRAGELLDLEDPPWMGQAVDEIDRDKYMEYYWYGPTQDGKTLLMCAILMWAVFELRENTILGIPVMDMAQGIWDDKVLPVIMAGRYRAELPKHGAGSRKGKFTSIRFRNGVLLRFMAAGGKDEQRSSHTSRIIVLTEIDKMCEAGESSKETDPVTQIISRATAFDEEVSDPPRVYGECTVSTKRGRIWKEINGKGRWAGQVWIRCPHCKKYVVPERGRFIGWENAPDDITAMEGGHYTCNACEKKWTERDRRKAIEYSVIAGRGQTVDKKGKIKGKLPRTTKWGFHWTALHSSLKSMKRLSRECHDTENSTEDDAEKKLSQFWFADPYKPEMLEGPEITQEILESKIGAFPRARMPVAADELCVGIDIGETIHWWIAVGFSAATAEAYIIDYGSIPVMPGPNVALAMVNALRSFRENRLKYGWEGRNGMVLPGTVLVDVGYGQYQDEICEFVKESGKGIYWSTKGFGSGANQPAWSEPIHKRGKKADPNVRYGNNWRLARVKRGNVLLEMHSDYWKTKVHHNFIAEPNTPGSMYLYKAEPRDHMQIVRHLLAEKGDTVPFMGPAGGYKTIWTRLGSRPNHWFDALYACLVGADLRGIRLVGPKPKRKADPNRYGGAPAADPGEAKRSDNSWKIGRSERRAA